MHDSAPVGLRLAGDPYSPYDRSGHLSARAAAATCVLLDA